jgi:hypothetical protein
MAGDQGCGGNEARHDSVVPPVIGFRPRCLQRAGAQGRKAPTARCFALLLPFRAWNLLAGWLEKNSSKSACTRHSVIVLYNSRFKVRKGDASEQVIEYDEQSVTDRHTRCGSHRPKHV